MDWLVFGDDWGAHPSTTQYLVKHLPSDDRVVWVNSIGMRSPKPVPRDFLRAIEKLRNRKAPTESQQTCVVLRDHMEVIEPDVLPLHHLAWARKRNARSLGQQITAAFQRLGITNPNVLLANPVGYHYLPEKVRSLNYLRLDDYPLLPGVDEHMVRKVEGALLPASDVIWVTAESLTVSGFESKSVYLPQGVETEHFSGVTETPPANKTLGFFGLLAEWLDYDLVKAVATALPDWTLEFVGPVRSVPEDLHQMSNIRLLAGVPYSELPQVMDQWDAAWIPFQVNELTRGVNPLKLREYLAGGLPTCCTGIPEAERLQPAVEIIQSAQSFCEVLPAMVSGDSMEKRQQRKASVSQDSWACRALQIDEKVRSLSEQ